MTTFPSVLQQQLRDLSTGRFASIGYIKQRPDEVEVLFTLMAERYERRSLMITSNLVFSEWDQIFQNPMTTAAAIDRLVHHSVILEFDVSSYRTAEKLKEAAGEGHGR
ncbi:MAG: DNA replication protein DnaC [Myxococcota bacterium]